MDINILVAMTSKRDVHIAMRLEELCQKKFVKVTNEGEQNAIQNRIKAVANKPNANWYKH